MADYKSRTKAGLERGQAEDALESFLEPANEAKVFALKGDWGVGKTHLVKTFLSKKQKEYYYGSVFGVSSIDELKMQLWSNFQPVRREEKSNSLHKFFPWRKGLQNTKDNLGSLEKLLEMIPSVGKPGGIIASSAISLGSNILINNMLKHQLICIDDIERKSKKLSLDDLLGFIEKLAEENECKIILIFNEDKITEDKEAEKSLRDYREKVVDIEIKLNPSAAENFYIGFGKDDPDEKIIFDYLQREYVQTNNIRVLKKLRWILGEIRPAIQDFLPKIRQQIIEEVIFISLSKFDKKFFIDLGKLVSLGDYPKVLDNKKEEDKTLYLTAISLGYSGSLISDEIICLVETSICDYQKITEEGKKLNDREEQNKIRERLQEAYRPYYESFGFSEQELCKNLTKFLDDCCVFLDIKEIINIEEIAKAINIDFSNYKKKWLKYNISSSDSLNSLNSWKSLLQEFPDLIREVEEKIKSIEEMMTITQVLSKSIKDRGWSEDEVNYLNGRTVEEYKQWLIERHPDHYYMVKQGLKMGGICSENLKKAIVELARESKLNAMRAKNLYNIEET